MNWEWLWRRQRMLFMGAALGALLCYGAFLWTGDSTWRIPEDLVLLALGSTVALLADDLGQRAVKDEVYRPRHMQSTVRPDSPGAVCLVLGSIINGRAAADLIGLLAGQRGLGDFLGILVAVATFLVAAPSSGRIRPRGRWRGAETTEEDA